MVIYENVPGSTDVRHWLFCNSHDWKYLLLQNRCFSSLDWYGRIPWNPPLGISRRCNVIFSPSPNNVWTYTYCFDLLATNDSQIITTNISYVDLLFSCSISRSLFPEGKCLHIGCAVLFIFPYLREVVKINWQRMGKGFFLYTSQFGRTPCTIYKSESPTNLVFWSKGVVWRGRM